MKCFDWHIGVRNPPGKVSCIAAWDDLVYVGTQDGFVALYRVELRDGGAGETGVRVVFECKRNLSRKGKKPISQLEVVPALGKLLVLCEGNIEVVNLLSLEFASAVPTKGAMLLCHEKGDDIHSFRLAVVTRRKKLLFFSYENEYEPQAEVALPEVPLAMEFYAGKVCLGFRRGYALVHARTYAIQALKIPVERAPPLICLVDNTLLLRADAQGIFVSAASGKPTGRKIKWLSKRDPSRSSLPSALGYAHPYVLSMYSGHVEVHNARTGLKTRRVQRLDAERPGKAGLVRLCHSGRCVVCASQDIVGLLVPVALEDQVKQLLHQELVVEAEELLHGGLRGAPDLPEKLAAFHEAAGFVYVKHLEWPSAYQHWRASNIDPRELIAMWPDMGVPEQHPYVPQHTGIDVEALVVMQARRAQQLERNLKDEGAPPIDSEPIGEQEMLRAGKLRLIDYLQGVRDHQDEQVRAWVDTALVECCAEVDQEALRTMLVRPDSVPTTVGAATSALRPTSTYFPAVEAYLRSRGLHGAIARVQECRGLLPAALQTYADLRCGVLVDAMGCDGVEDASALLAVVEQPVMLARYLPPLLSTHPDAGVRAACTSRPTAPGGAAQAALLGAVQEGAPSLVPHYLEHAVWVWAIKDAAAHTLLATSLAHKVIDLLKTSPSSTHTNEAQRDGEVDTKISSEPSSGEESTKLLDGDDADGDDADGGVDEGVAGVQGAGVDSSLGDGNSVELSKVRSRLQRCLRESKLYNASALLHLLHDFPLVEEHVLLLSRLGRHREALFILVHRLGDVVRAEKYAEQWDDATEDNLFVALLQAHLDEKPHKDFIPDPMGYLDRFASKLNPVDVVPLLPAHISIQQLQPYLLKALHHATHSRRQTMVVRNLRKLEHLNTSYQLVSLTNTRIEVGPDTVCAVCRRPLDTSAFAAYPNGVLVHHKCFSDAEVCPVTGTSFSS